MHELDFQNKPFKNVISIDFIYTFLKLQKHIALVWKVTLVGFKFHSKAQTVGFPLVQLDNLFQSVSSLKLYHILYVHVCISFEKITCAECVFRAY